MSRSTSTEVSPPSSPRGPSSCSGTGREQCARRRLYFPTISCHPGTVFDNAPDGKALEPSVDYTTVAKCYCLAKPRSWKPLMLKATADSWSAPFPRRLWKVAHLSVLPAEAEGEEHHTLALENSAFCDRIKLHYCLAWLLLFLRFRFCLDFVVILDGMRWHYAPLHCSALRHRSISNFKVPLQDTGTCKIDVNNFFDCSSPYLLTCFNASPLPNAPPPLTGAYSSPSAFASSPLHPHASRNEDRAGAVLQVLDELESAGVNVGRLNVGRQEVRRLYCFILLYRASSTHACRQRLIWRHVF